MNPTDPLSELRGLSMPEPSLLDWWPLSLGWWILLILVIAGIYFLVVFIRRKNEDSWYKQALQELTAIRLMSEVSDLNEQELLTRCSALCRRVAMAVEGREAIARLTGKAWLETLDRLSASREFTAGSGALLDNRLWQKQPAIDGDTQQRVLDVMLRLIENNKPGRSSRRRTA